MRVTKKAEYAVVLSEELARAGGETVSLRQVADARQLAYSFLRQVAATMRENGLIVGSEGKGGGYRLARKPSAITVAEILAAAGEPIRDSVCGACSQCSVIHKIQCFVEQTFGQVTLDRIARGEVGCVRVWENRESRIEN